MKYINLTAMPIYRCLFLLLCMGITSGFIMAQAPEVNLDLENVREVGNEVLFDIYLHADPGHQLNFAQSDLSFTFDHTLFGSDLAVVIESGALKEVFASVELLDLPDGSKAVQISWNLHQEEAAFPANFSDGSIPQVDPVGVLLGSFRLQGKTGVGDAGLAWRSESLMPTQVWHYRESDHHVEKATATLGEGGALPVELLEFMARKGPGNEVLLEWQTGSEVNASHFEIEKQIGGDTFYPIGTQAAVGNSTTPKGYSFVDQTPMAPVVYYRLKSVDLDGSFSYSQTVEVFFESLDQRFEIFPNPVEDILTLKDRLLQDEIVRYEVSDLRGKVLIKGLWESHRAALQLDLSKWAKGTYQLILADGRGSRFSSKIVKN